MNNIIKLSDYKKQLVSLRIMNASTKGQCLPSNWKYVTTINYNADSNQIVIRQDSKSSSDQSCNSRPINNQVVINPVDLGLNGIALSYWIKEDYSKISDSSMNIISGYINNIVVFNYNLAKSLDSGITHTFKVQNDTKTIESSSSCAEWVFVMISVQKDCDKYRLVVSTRFPGSNTRSFFEQKLNSNEIENIVFVLTNNNNIQFNEKRYTTNFHYNFENEMILMNINRPENVNSCPNPLPNCQYNDFFGRCIVCKKNYFWHNYECIENCPTGYFGRNRKCEKCYYGCKSCTGEYEYQCTDCYEEMDLYLYDNRCKPSCPYYTYKTTTLDGKKICKICDINCESCCGKDKCCKCKGKYYLYKNTCVSDCPTGYYIDYWTDTCNKCEDNCESCTSKEFCKGCFSGYFLKDNKYCVTDCKDGYYKNTKTYTCDKCLYGCRICKEKGRCDDCETPFNLKKKLDQDECEPKCPDGKTYLRGGCADCVVPNCRKCPDPTICEDCIERDGKTYYFKNGNCQEDCGSNHYKDEKTRKCIKCDCPNCDKCDKDSCLDCNQNYLLLNYHRKHCRSECPDGTYQSGSQCFLCTNPSRCKKCSPYYNEKCTQCYDMEYLKDNDCVKDCGPEYYRDSKKCYNCADGCLRCKNSYTCDVCKDGYYHLKEIGGLCYKPCPEGYTGIINYNNVMLCIACEDNNCLKCRYSNECDKCKSGYYLLNGKCFKECEQGTYLSPYNTCLSCKSHCIDCTNNLNCKRCDSLTYLENNECKEYCKDGSIPINGECVECKNTKCRKCYTNDLIKCKTCYHGKYLYDNECYDECPRGTYKYWNICVDCKFPCKECKNDKECKDCYPKYNLLSNATCSDTSCKEGFTKINDNCEPCYDKNCFTCPQRICKICKENYVLQDENCVKECYQGYVEIDRKCVKCKVPNCNNCDINQNCIECEENYCLLNSMECLSYPRIGWTKYGKQCLRCNYECKTCLNTNTNYCTSCYKNNYLQLGKCKNRCDVGFYVNSNEECAPCEVNFCGQCDNNPKICDTCIDNYYLLNNKCVNNCGLGYTIIDNKRCKQCDVLNCKDCPHHSICKICMDDFYLINSKECNKDCPDYTYKDTNTKKCEDCLYRCRKCSDSFTCNECEDNTFLHNKNSCVKFCDEPYYGKNKKCIRCPNNYCSKCNPDNPKYCYKCERPYKLKNNDCTLDDCGPGKFYDKDNNECTDCSYQCKECENKNECKECNNNYVLDPNKRCTGKCPIGYKENSKKICVLCDITFCRECEGNEPEICIECVDQKYLLDNKKCVSECEPPYYNSDRKCLKCMTNCFKCKSGTTCEECNIGFYLKNKICVDYCPLEYWTKFNNNKECVECPTMCRYCNHPQLCDVCREDHFLLNGQCVLRCGVGYYHNYVPKKTCNLCPENCADCPDSGKCIKCKEGYYRKINENTCVEKAKCIKGYYINETDKTCNNCPYKCDDCDANLKCSKCESGFLLYKKNNQCLVNCEIKTYRENDECKDCLTNCCSCGNSDTCSECCDTTDFKYLASNTKSCVANCDIGEYISNRKCKKCSDINCEECNNSEDCRFCKDGYYLHPDNKCKIDKCKIYYYSDEKRRCKKCSRNCEKCKDNNICEVCDSDSFLLDNICVEKCKVKEVRINGICVKCQAKNCNNCIKDTQDKCDICEDNYYEKDMSCVLDCGKNYYPTYSPKRCRKCSDFCSDCKDDKSCTECTQGMVVMNNKCQEKCDDNYVPIKGVCNECKKENCLICSSDNINKCIKCKPQYYLNGFDCRSDCPVGHYKFFPSDTFWECKKCPENCNECYDSESCIKCKDEYVWKVNKCEQCSEGYVTFEKKCVRCYDHNCLVCEENRKICKKCKTDFYLQDGACVNPCYKNYIANSNRECERCEDINCLICSPNKNTCKYCIDGYFLNNQNKCVSFCDYGFRPTVQRTCKSCEITNCASCSYNHNICDYCIYPYILFNNTCISNCRKGQVMVNGVCHDCIPDCASCSSPYTCDECTYPFFKNDSYICRDKCKSNQVDINGTCTDCTVSNCMICEINLIKCKYCEYGYLLDFDGKCVKKCNPGYYANYYTRKCEKCNNICGSCNRNALPCEDCAPGLIFYKGYCYETCPDGTIKIGERCEDCTAKYCLKCNPNNLNQCPTCYSDFVNDQDICLPNCPLNKINVNGKCVICTENCAYCLPNKTCDRCEVGFYKYNGKCYNTCKEGTVAYYGECIECTNPRCKTCLGDYPSKCTSCIDKYFLRNYECEPNSCPDGEYNAENNKCYECSNGCLKCKSFNICEICSNGYTLRENSLGKFCVKNDTPNTCEDGKKQVGNKCVKCDIENCKTCNNSSNICPECMSNYFLYGNMCFEKCPNGYYGFEKKCYKCPSRCKTCNMSGNCEECLSDYYLMNGKCYDCLDIYYAINNKDCYECNVKNCLLCNRWDYTKCIYCRFPYFLVDNQCELECKRGKYLYQNSCINCPENCEKCINGSICEECASGLYLFNGRCLKICPEGYTPSKDGKCVKCADKDCEVCCSENPNQCCKCKSNRFGYNKKCYDKCPYGTYPDRNKNCISCPSDCEGCEEKDICTGCVRSSKKKLQEGICVDNCKAGYYYDYLSNTCYKCDDVNCIECAPKNFCKKCNKDTILNKRRNTCVYTCGKKFFHDKINNTCESCSNLCERCTNDSTCTECIYGYYLLRNGTCITNCQPGETFVNGECVKCSDKDCLECVSGEPDNCRVCKKEMYVFNYKCKKECERGTYKYIDENNQYKCKECDSRCSSCDSSGCDDCITGFIKINRQCINPCPIGSTPYNGYCTKCSVENCNTCDSELSKCIECSPGFYLLNGECFRQCRDGYYIDGKICSPCSKDCRKCKNPNECEDCTTILFNGKCVNACDPKYYSLCYNGITRCENCKKGCYSCINGNSCLECEDHLIKYRGNCIQTNECPAGRYVDRNNRLCRKCKIAFCEKCDDASSCSKCRNGYELKYNTCVENKNFKVIFSSPYLFNEYTQTNLNDMREVSIITGAGGHGIGSSEIALSFWMRFFSPKFDKESDSRIFEIRVPSINNNNSDLYSYTSTNTFKITFGLSKTMIGDPSCYLSITTPTNSKTIKVIGHDCSFKNLNNRWKLFIIQFKKRLNGYGKIMLKSYNDKTFNIDHEIENIPSELNFDLISRDSVIYFNEDAVKNPVYELANFYIMNYITDDVDLYRYYLIKPNDCDFMCSSCQSTCKSCINGALLNNGKCPPSFLSIIPNNVQFSSPTTFTLRSFTNNKRISSDSFNLYSMFYISSNTNLDRMQIFNLSYKTNYLITNILDFSLDNGYAKVKVGINEEKTYDNNNNSKVLRDNQWYALNLAVSPDSVIIQIIEWGNGVIVVNQNLNKISEIIRLNEDAIFSIGSKPSLDNSSSKMNPFSGTISDVRLYVNGFAYDNEFINYMGGLKCDPNCKTCNERLACINCKENFVVNSAGKCDSLGSARGNVLLTKLSIFDRKSKSFTISNNGDFSFFVWFRKKIHSLVPQNNNAKLISINGKPILSEMFYQNYSSNYTISSPFEDYNSTVLSDNSDTNFEWYQFFFVKSGKTFSIKMVDSRNSSLDLTNKAFNNDNQVITLTIGDDDGEQINSEFAWLTVLDNSIKNYNLYNEQPKDCDSSCVSCNYQTGSCDTCKSNGSSGKTCPNYSMFLRKSVIMTTKDYTSNTGNKFNSFFNIRVNDDFQVDVNSLNYSVSTWFSLFNKYSNQNMKDKSILLFRLSNNDNVDKYSAIYTPSRSLIEFVIKFEESGSSFVPIYYFVVSQMNTTQLIRVDSLTVREFDFIYIHAGVNVNDKKFSYTIYSKTDNNEFTKSVVLSNYPEKLQEVATLKLFGVNSIIQDNFDNPNGIFINTELFINIGYKSDNVSKKKNSFDPTIDTTPCDTNCDRCIVGICQSCKIGYNKENNVCVRKTSTSYILLTDEKYLGENQVSINKNGQYSVPVSSSVVMQNHGFQVFFRRNYLPTSWGVNLNEMENRKILNYGVLSIYLVINSQTQASIRIFNRELPSNVITLGPIDTDSNKDYDWHALILYLDCTSGNLIATLQSSNIGKIDQKTTSFKKNQFDSISFFTLSNEISFVGATIVPEVPAFQSSLFPFPLLNCPVDCSLCVQNSCRACDYGELYSNSCKKKAVRANNIVVSPNHDSPNSFSLYDQLKYSSNPRFNDFTIVFSITSNKIVPNIGTFFRITNNADSSLSRYDSNSINYNILSLQRTSIDTYILSYNTRNLVESQRNSVSINLNKLPNTIISDTTTIGISVDSTRSLFNIIISNGLSNSIFQSIRFEGIFDNLGTYTRVIFGENYKRSIVPFEVTEPFIARDINFFYEKTMNMSDLQFIVSNQAKKYQQVACQNYGIKGCDKCFDSNIKPIKGICIPEAVTRKVDDETLSRFINYNYSIVQSLNNRDMIPRILGPFKNSLTKFSFGFQYRRISYPEYDFISILSLVIKSSDSTKPLITFYERKNSLYMINSINPNGNLIGILENVYTEKKRFEWQSINLSCDIPSQSCEFSVYNYKSESTITEKFTSSLPSISEFNVPADSEMSILYDFSTIDVRLNNNKINPGENTEWEISNLIFLPNYTISYSELNSLRLPVPSKCDRRCSCECNSFKICPEKCLLKDDIINLMDGYNSKTSQSLFRPIYNYIATSVYSGNNQVTDQTPFTYDNFIINFELNVKSYISTINSVSNLKRGHMARFKEQQISTATISSKSKYSSSHGGSNSMNFNSFGGPNWNPNVSISGGSGGSNSGSGGSNSDPNSMPNGNQSSNSNNEILFILSNQYIQLRELRVNNNIADEFINYSILSVKVLDRSTLRFYIGSSPLEKVLSFKDINLRKSLENLTKLNVIVYIDSKGNYARITVIADDMRFDDYLSFNYSVEPINKSTLIYNHSEVTSSNLIISNVRLDYAINLLQRDTNVYQNYCNRDNCNQCLHNPNGDICLVCNSSFGLLNGVCSRKTFTINYSDKKKRISELKSRKQNVIKNN